MAVDSNTIDSARGHISLRSVVAAAVSLQYQRQEQVFVVGGFVRDLLLNRSIGDFDVDLVVEGDGLAFARELRGVIGGELREHGSFLTAKLTAPFTMAGGDAPFLSEVDIATARKEEYSRPGALPTVTPTTIDMDLWRRDFSANALALPLEVYRDFLGGGVSHESLASKIVDPCGGISDLQSNDIRILHPKSFIDDPTRLFRAVRYAVRLSFHFDKSTLSGFYDAVRSGALATLTPRRIWNEVVCALDESKPSEVLQEFVERGLLTHLTIVPPDQEDAVIAALERIEKQRSLVSPEQFKDAGKLIVLAGMLVGGREDVAQATGEGGKKLKVAARVADGVTLPGANPSNEEALALYGLHGSADFLRVITRKVSA